MRKIKDWIRPYSQLFALILLIGLTIKCDCANIYLDILTKGGFQNSDFPKLISIAYVYGRPTLSFAIIFFVLYKIRTSNKEAVLNIDNNMYHNHVYIEYFVCRYLLGYYKCNLKLVPISMQYRLVISGIFPEYIYCDGIHEAKDETIKILKNNDEAYTNCVNLVISDTYKITTEQLPSTVLNLTTIEIDRFSNDNMRYKSEELIKNVISVVRDLPENVIEVNIFATTNPTNTYNIAKEVFATGNRDSIQHIYVFEQEQTNARKFLKTGVKIY